MKTPKNYTDNLKKGIVTDEMLASAIFSVNKRAKNARDKESELREYYRSNRYASDTYGSEDRARERKEQYYSIKDELLGFAADKFKCIHRVPRDVFKKKRIYDYQPEYDSVCDDDVVYENSYYDKNMDMEVSFVDVMVYKHTAHDYYMFYDFGTRSFHHPIDLSGVMDKAGEIAKYGKEVVDIEGLETSGENVENLLSMNFVNKVLEVLKAA